MIRITKMYRYVNLNDISFETECLPSVTTFATCFVYFEKQTAGNEKPFRSNANISKYSLARRYIDSRLMKNIFVVDEKLKNTQDIALEIHNFFF